VANQLQFSRATKDQLKTLPKGNQQKVQLISTIVHRPKIVFLDEPFSGLDPVNQEKVTSFLQLLRQQSTTIIPAPNKCL
jgi:ABC-2 type transport system ATP-binding protein